MRKLSTLEFIERSNIIHKNFYNYIKTKYISVNKPVCVICPKHGEFFPLAGNHLKGCKCLKCSYEQRFENRRCKINDLIKKANEIHNNKYNYDRFIYKNIGTKGIILCSKHGEFLQTFNDHINSKAGCPNCANNKKKSMEEFIIKAKEVHGNRYDYSEFVYNGNSKKSVIICSKHGRFFQNYVDHVLKKAGCPKCWGTISKKEIQFVEYLKRNNRSSLLILSQTDVGYKEKLKIIRNKISRKFRPDLLICGNDIIIVEFDGDFWHGNSNEKLNKKINISMIQLKRKTEEKKKIYSKYFQCINILSSEWDNWIIHKQVSQNIQFLFNLLKFPY